MKYNYHAITLDKKEIGETDRLYTFYTYENGIIRVPARAIRKGKAKLAMQVEDFVFSHITIAKNYGRGVLAGAVAERYFCALHENYFALKCADEVRNVLLTIIGENDMDRQTFILFVQYLTQLNSLAQNNNNNEKMQWMTDAFLIKIFASQGYIFNTHSCCVCTDRMQEVKNCFSVQHGGVICRDCSTKEKYFSYIDVDTIKALRIIQDNKLTSLNRVIVHEKVQIQLGRLILDIKDWIMR